MSDLRERAAIAALAGASASRDPNATDKSVAEWAVAAADAFVAELEKESRPVADIPTVAHVEAIEAGKVLGQWARRVGPHPISTCAHVIGASLANIAQMVSTCEPHEREEIAERLVALADALKGKR